MKKLITILILSYVGMSLTNSSKINGMNKEFINIFKQDIWKWAFSFEHDDSYACPMWKDDIFFRPDDVIKKMVKITMNILDLSESLDTRNLDNMMLMEVLSYISINNFVAQTISINGNERQALFKNCIERLNLIAKRWGNRTCDDLFLKEHFNNIFFADQSDKHYIKNDHIRGQKIFGHYDNLLLVGNRNKSRAESIFFPQINCVDVLLC